MQVETLIYAYLAVCVSMILFNCACIFLALRRGKALQKCSFGLKVQVQRQLERLERGLSVEQAHVNYLQKKLVKIGNLLAFDEALSGFTIYDNEVLERYLREIHPVFIFLTVEYRKKEKMQLAYFAYVIGKYHIINGMPFDLVMEVMLLLLNEPSLYLRENALQAIYASGNSKCVADALKIVDEGAAFHHIKLLTDGMLTFRGDHRELADMLLKAFDDYSQQGQLAILDFLRFDTGERCSEMLALLTDERRDDEIRFACIRYFAKYCYNPAYPALIVFAENPDAQRWEYAAIAATALANYRSERTIRALKGCLFHSNWYIRLNAAQSLEAFQLSYWDLIDVFDSNDRYAREILQYQMDRKNIGQGQEVNVG